MLSGKGDGKLELEKALQEKNINGEIIFSMIAGSSAFNLRVEGSDEDFFGVYLSGLEQAVSSVLPAITSIDKHNPDIIVYELSFYFELLLKGNPKVIEPLFATHVCHTSPVFDEVKKIRDTFINQKTLHQYVQYAKSFLPKGFLESEKLETPQKVTDVQTSKGKKKKFYHCLRLLSEAKRIVQGQHPIVWFEGEEREFLMSIRRNEVSEADIKEQVQSYITYIETNQNRIPALADVSIVNQKLIDIRTQQLHSYAQEMKRLGTLTPVLLKSMTEWEKKQNKTNNETNTEEHSNSNVSVQEVGEREQKWIKKAEELLRKNLDCNFKLLCLVPSGSFAHNLSNQDECDDFIGIFCLPTEEILKIDKRQPTRVTEFEDNVVERENHQRGMVLMELDAAVHHLLQGQYRMMEVVFSSLTGFADEHWKTLLQSKSNWFLASSTASSFHGTAEGSLKKLKHAVNNAKGRADEKQEILKIYKTLHFVFYHLEQAERIWSGREPMIWINDDSIKEFLLKVKEGRSEMTIEDAISMAEKRLEFVGNLRKSSKLSKRADKSLLHQWLVALRLENWFLLR